MWQQGPRVGARLPNLDERGRILGAPETWLGLRQQGLSLRQIFDSQGNAFDPRVVYYRLGRHIEAWLRGDTIPNCEVPDPTALDQIFDAMTERVRRRGLPTHPHPGPDPELFAMAGPPPSDVSPDEIAHAAFLAAEDGRDGQ